MQPRSFDINYFTGDMGYVYLRSIPTADGIVPHCGVLKAGDYDALASGVIYTNEAFDSEAPIMQNLSFPNEIKEALIVLWETDAIKSVVSDRLKKAEEEAEVNRVAAQENILVAQKVVEKNIEEALKNLGYKKS